MHLSRDQQNAYRRWRREDRPRTDLSGADLADADLLGARYNAGTRWPVGFDPLEHGAEVVPQSDQS
jgi:hypothetical protein